MDDGPCAWGAATRANLGPAYDAGFQPDGPGRFLTRNTEDPATSHWKGYRGGCVGEVWVDVAGDGAFRRLDVRVPGSNPGGGGKGGKGKDAFAETTSVGNIGWVSWCARDKIVFVADDGGGRANLYSLTPPDAATCAASDAAGSDVPVLATRHTARSDFCVRHPAADAAHSLSKASNEVSDAAAAEVTVAYCAGGRLFVSRVGSGPAVGVEVPITWRGPRAQLERRQLSDNEEYVESWDLHPEGLTLAVVVRGQAFTMGLWDGPALAYPPAAAAASTDNASRVGRDPKTDPPGAEALAALSTRAAPRARLAVYLWDGVRVCMTSDASGEDDLEVHLEDGALPPRRLNVPPAVLGRPEALVPSPESPLVAVVNHRSALLIVDAESGHVRTADASPESRGIRHVAWSHCGNWLAYTRHVDVDLSCVRILDVRTGVARDATDPVLGDCCPSWDPAGDFLYFLSTRELEPSYDAGRFGLSFHGVHRPHALALRSDVRNPLLRELRPPHDSESDEDSDASDEEGSSSASSDASDESDPDAPEPLTIEFEGLAERVVALPMPAGRYSCLTALDDGRFMLVKYPVGRAGRVGLDAPYYDDDDDAGSEDGSEDGGPAGGGALLRFDVKQLKTSVLVEGGVRSVQLSIDRRCMVVETSEEGYRELRVYKAGIKPDDEDSDGEEVDTEGFDRRSGLIDVEGRVHVMIDPRREWAQMLGEAWRRLRDEWWSPTGMTFGDGTGEVADWPGTLARYAAVLPRVAARSELSDIITEMAAELRSSHVSVCTGDDNEVRRRKSHQPGLLGCDVVWDETKAGYRVTHIVRGDAWDETTGGALCKPGVNVAVGDVLTHVNRVRLTREVSPAQLLIGKGGVEVLLTCVVGDGPRVPIMAGAGGDLAARVAAVSLKTDRTDRRTGKQQKTTTTTGNHRPTERGRHPAGAKGRKEKSGAGVRTADPVAPPASPASATKVKRRPGKSFHVRVRAMHSELDARYRDMVRGRTAAVARLGGGRVGYLHLPDMERTGYSEFWRHYASEVRKGALLVDLRGNGGGHISELILAKLAQRPLAWDVPRRGRAVVYPSHASGPVVVLVNENTGSDAELAAEGFRRLGLGTVVGTRTWGGLLTVSDTFRLVDGSEVCMPQQNVVLFTPDFTEDGARSNPRRTKGNAIENAGVAPDIEVVITPADHAAGRDPQLEAAVTEALRLLRTSPPPAPPVADTSASPADVVRAAACERNLPGGRWPFKTYAPYPEDKESEDEESEDEESEDDTSEDEGRKGGGRGGRRGAAGPKGARPRR